MIVFLAKNKQTQNNRQGNHFLKNFIEKKSISYPQKQFAELAK